VRFDGSRVAVSQRFVHTAKAAEEDAAGHALYRTFGTRFDGDRLEPRRCAHVSGGTSASRCLRTGSWHSASRACPSSSRPTRSRPRGPFDFGGSLTDLTPFSAHPRRDPEVESSVNFGVSFAADRPTLNLFTFDASARLASRRRIALDLPRTIHDFALTKRVRRVPI
jgi:carotenoid cleavage dioxygenase-like enzyme